MPKKSTSRTQKQLVAESADLCARLEEAEAMYAAKQAGRNRTSIFSAPAERPAESA